MKTVTTTGAPVEVDGFLSVMGDINGMVPIFPPP